MINHENQKELIRQFIRGCSNRDAVKAAWVIHGEPNTYADAYQQVLTQEGRIESLVCMESGHQYNRAAVRSAPEPMDVNAVLNKSVVPCSQRSNLPSQFGFSARRPRNPDSTAATKPRNELRQAVAAAAKSRSTGATATAGATSAPKPTSAQRPAGNRPTLSNAMKCYNCQGRGHRAQDCPEPRRQRVHAITTAPDVEEDEDDDIPADAAGEEQFDQWTDDDDFEQGEEVDDTEEVMFVNQIHSGND